MQIADAIYRPANRHYAALTAPTVFRGPDATMPFRTGLAPDAAASRDAITILRYALWQCQIVGDGAETPSVDTLLGAIAHVEDGGTR